MSRKHINLKEVFNAELIGPNWSDFGFALKFQGSTPGGKDLDVTVRLPAWGVEYVGRHLNDALKKQQNFLEASRAALRGE